MASHVDAAPQVEVLRWPEFAARFKREHRQGEHVSIVGQTGSGKTVLGLSLCEILATRKQRSGRPAQVTVLATKPRDATLTRLGWPTISEWPPPFGKEHSIVWPKAKSPSTAAREQARVFRPLLDRIYHEGGQTIYIDEASYFERPPPNGLGLAGTMEQYWSSARSLNLTLIAATQRPRNVSRSMWSEPSFVMIFPPDDLDDLKRVAELSGRKADVMSVAERLGGFEFLTVQRQRDGRRRLLVSRVGT